MFLIYVNDIGDQVSSTIKLFADDCLLYRQIGNEEDAAQLQADFARLNSWANTWQMDFNPTKCYVMRMSRKRDSIHYNYNINSTLTLKGFVICSSLKKQFVQQREIPKKAMSGKRADRSFLFSNKTHEE